MKTALRLSSLTLLCLFLSFTSGCYSLARMAGIQAEGSFRSAEAVDGPLDLEVTTGSGKITISGSDSDEIEVVARVRASANSMEAAEEIVREIENDPPIEYFGDRVVVGRFDDDRRYNRVSISYDIRVPTATTVRAQTGSGGAEITGLTGDIDVRTGSGQLIISDINGTVRAQTGSGGIDAEAIAGAFDGRTGSGGLTLYQTTEAEVDVNTGSGSIRLYGVSGPLRARAGSGGIRVEGDPSDTWYLNTGSGGVTLTLSSDAAFDLDARTNSGSVEVSSPLDFDGTTDRRNRNMRGQVNDGGPSVEIRSGSGSIRVQGE